MSTPTTTATPTTTTTPSSLAISTSSLPSTIVDSDYSAMFAATGGTGPYTWSTSASGGALPAGLVLTSTGALTGTPAAAGTFPFTIQVTDSANSTATKSSNMTVAFSTTTPSSDGNGNVGDPYEGGGPIPLQKAV